MDFNEVKKWLNDPSERFVFIEDGKPAYVAMGFEAYQALKGGVKPNPINSGKAKDQTDVVNANLEAERVRAKDLVAKMSMEFPRSTREAEAEDAEEMPRVRLEDLPL
ncbi:MAG: hypothetical protein HYT39_01835 [Candidatus Sungbacteria bacterium]|nr:hypothetical protein [Candidatus Sungbacteria bacterium]